MKRINDGLNKSQRHRLKDLKAYQKRKREYARTPQQRKKRNEYMRKWRAANRELHNRLARESHQRNRHKHINRNRDWSLRKLYGITLAQKIAMIEAQHGLCGICAREFEDTRRTHVDHCHSRKVVRGILCNVCNTKLEWFENNKDAIINYLKKYELVTDTVW